MALSPYVRLTLTIALLLCIGGGIYVYRSYAREPETVIMVTRGDVTKQVSVTGKARAVQEVDLAFQTGGTIQTVQARVGSRVLSGDILAVLNTAEMQAALNEALASRDAEVATLGDLSNGARPEDLAVLQAKLESARLSEIDATSELRNALRNAYTVADDAVHNKADRLIDMSGRTPTLRITPPDLMLVLSIERTRGELDPLFTSWEALSNLDPTLSLGISVLNNLEKVQSYLAALSQAANASNASTDLSDSDISTYRVNLASARNAIESSLSEVQGALAAVRNASSAVSIAERTLLSEKAGSTELALLAQEARVKQFDAQVESIRAQLTRANLVAPISGVVTRQSAKVGQVAHAGETLISVISDADLEIEAYVPEISIGKVEVGNAARIAFDAFQDEVFDGVVAEIEPAETVIDGVTNFKVTVALTRKDPRLRRGLTADITIVSARRNNVLIVPEYVVERHDGVSYVLVRREEGTSLEPVALGLKGDDGAIEVLSGLREGDAVVVPLGEK